MSKSGYFFRVSELDRHAEKLNKFINNQIEKNVFSRVVRDAIRLYADLADGKTDVLEELFPFVRTHYCGNQDPDELKNLINDAVRKAMNEQGRVLPDGRTQGFPLMSPEPKGIPAAPVAVVAAAKVASAEEISDNFLNCFLQ